MHIVFDLQAATALKPAGAVSVPAARGLRLATAMARHPEMPGHRLSLLVPANDVEDVVHIRRQIDSRFADRIAVRTWQPLQGASDWHRQVNAELYRQLLGRIGADALVIDDSFGDHLHPLKGAPDWLPGGCIGVFLVEQGTRPADLPGDRAVWSGALDRHQVLLCGLLARAPDLSHGGEGRDDDDEALAAAHELSDALRHLRANGRTGPTLPTLPVHPAPPFARPRLAYVSPLPSARTGIADYSADLIAALGAHYAIELVVEQPEVDAACLPPGSLLRSVEWFMEHGGEFDRVLYHFGNSPFHRHMPALCERYPGTVVLHDFYLGDLLYYLCERSGQHGARWAQALYRSHGYAALSHAQQHDALREVLAHYPLNFDFLRHSHGVIVHSKRACDLAAQWLPAVVADRFRHIPLLRLPVPEDDREARRFAARHTLGIAPDRFLVCCFGMVGRAKANLEILQAWLRMDASVGGHTQLVFVGANDDGAYGQRLLDAIAASGDAAERVRITGWIDKAGYRWYLDAADVGVQLRTIDRGETSAAALDCMNHGLATIVNSKGSMAELPQSAVRMIPADCGVQDIADAMTALHRDPAARAALAGRAAELVGHLHAPFACAQAYRDVLENDFYRHAAGFWQAAIPTLAQLPGTAGKNREELAVLSNAAAANLPNLHSARELLVDVSAIWKNDLKTGIQRVVRALLVELIQSPPAGWRIEPVYLCDLTGAWRLRYARQYTQALLGLHLQEPALEDEVVEAGAGDMFLGLDYSSGFIVEAQCHGIFDGLRKSGVALHFVVYDLLPLLRPEVFPQESQALHERWLRSVLQVGDGVTCISHAVAGELRHWMDQQVPEARVRISAFHLGADVMSSAPTYGMPVDAPRTLAALKARPTFLAVGTIEPRKGIQQVLAAFELLWHEGVKVNLVLVGKPGWHVDALVKALKHHAELGQRLFWSAGISDEYLGAIYGNATCLLAASEAEGFGLPLIEAAQQGLPILARDIPVFREVAGSHAFYFSGDSAQSLAAAVEEWLELHKAGLQPTSREMPWLTWRESALQLRRCLGI